MCYGPSDPQAILELVNKATVLVIGPGLSLTPWGKAFFDKTIGLHKNKVIDADGLNWLAQNPQKSSHWILTPHPGEAARLLNQSTCDVQKNRFQAARALKEKYGGVIVLKGAGTIIIDEDDTLTLQEGGFPVLATGGTGDVLAGLIGGLLSQGLSLSLAAKIGVSVHANAAKHQQEKGERGMLASDLFLSLRSLLNPDLQ
jgi:NAD(P)H-hydrate epimerase